MCVVSVGSETWIDDAFTPYPQASSSFGKGETSHLA